MAHKFQKRWVLTRNANENDQLIDHKKLEDFMNRIVKEGVFQMEKGKQTPEFYHITIVIFQLWMIHTMVILNYIMIKWNSL